METVEAMRITIQITEHTGEISQGRAVQLAQHYVRDREMSDLEWKLASAHWNRHRWTIILDRQS